MTNPSYRKLIHWLVILSVVISALCVTRPAQAASSLTVNITSPTAGVSIFTQGSVDVTFTVDGGPGQYKITIGSVVQTTDYETSGTISVTVNVSTLADGPYNLTVEALKDGETEWATDTEVNAVRVDKTAPVVLSNTLTAPNGGETIKAGESATYTITWDQTKITEASGTGASVAIELRNASLGTTATIATGLEIATGSYSWTVTGVPDENYKVCLIVTDPFERSGEDCSDAVFTIYAIDHDAPVLTITSPVDGVDAAHPTYVSGTINAVATASSASGITIVAFFLSTNWGDSWSSLGATRTPGTTTWTSENIVTTLYVDDTPLWIYAMAVNGLGNYTTSPTMKNIEVRNTAPSVEIDTPIEGAWLGSSGVLLQARASDLKSTISSVVFSYYKDSSWTTIGTASYDAVDDIYYISSWTPVLGATKIRATATNAAALTFSDEHTITVEQTAPTVTPEALLTDPDGGEILKIGNTFPITWDPTKVSDAGGNLGTNPVSLKLKNSVLGTSTVIASGLPLTPGSYSWLIAGVPNENHKICVVVTDTAGNTGEDCSEGVFTIWGIDTSEPYVNLATIPSYNQTGVTLSATASDSESGIYEVKFYAAAWDDTTWGTDTLLGTGVRGSDDTFTYAWAPADGHYRVTVVATNGVGKSPEDNPYQADIYFDTTAPVLSWTSLANSDTLSFNTVLTTTASDAGSGIAKVQWDWSTDSTNWHLIGSATTPTAGNLYSSPAWDTTDLEDGTNAYVIRVRVENNVGMTTSDTRTVSIENYTSLSLSAGWNLISLPLVPDHPALTTVLQDLIGEESLIRVTTFIYDTVASALDEQNYIPNVITTDLTTLKDGQGYWVNVTKDTTLEFAGLELPAPPAAPPTYKVYPGWNLIGFKSTSTTTSASTYLGPAVSALMQRPMYRYNAAQGIYVVVQASDVMIPGQGYWLALSGQGTIYP